MLRIVEQREDWVELHASGKLTREDYEGVIPELEAQLERQGQLSALILLEDFSGWTAGAALDELRFDLRHRKDFARVAVAGERTLEEWGTRLTAPFFSGEVRYFDRSRLAIARAWSQAQRTESGTTASPG